MATDKIIHFGHFMRHAIADRGMTLKELEKETGFSTKTLIELSKTQYPSSRGETLAKIGRALGYKTGEEFEEAWTTTKVSPARTKASGFLATKTTEDHEASANVDRVAAPGIPSPMADWMREEIKKGEVSEDDLYSLLRWLYQSTPKKERLKQAARLRRTTKTPIEPESTET